jgi:hypothetical protein
LPTIAFVADTVSSSSSIDLSSPHQDKILVAGDGNDDVEAQKGSLSRRTDQGPSHWKARIKETRHTYPKHQKGQSRGDGVHANIASKVKVDNRGADNQNRKKKGGTNNEPSGSMGNADIKQESSRATGSIIQGNTQKYAGHCHVCGFAWSIWDKALLIMFILSTSAAVVALILFFIPRPPHL